MGNFKEFLETDTVISKFLNIGLVWGEMSKYYESVSGLPLNRKEIYELNASMELLKRDPDTIARKIGGQNFVLKISSCRHKCNSNRTYKTGNVYYRKKTRL